MLARFDDKIVLVTGAAGGIGLETVKRIQSEGGTVYAGVLSSQMDDGLEGATPIAIDVTQPEQWAQAIQQIIQTYGRIDVLVNNAGIRESNLAEDTPSEQWHRLLDTNLMSAFNGCAAVIPHMRENGGGAIVNLSSITGIRGTRTMVAYSASKGGIVSMTSSLALDHAGDNIRVNCVCPGAILTPMVESMLDESDDRDGAVERLKANHPLLRIGRPEEVASVIAFLASDDASYMTGLAIPVDGGRSIR